MAAARGTPTGAGELVQETASFLGGLWSSGSGKHGDDKIGESEGRVAFEDFDMLVSGLGVGVGWMVGGAAHPVKPLVDLLDPHTTSMV